MKHLIGLLVFWVLFFFQISAFSKLNLEYQSETLVIKKVSDHAYNHISYLKTDSFGKVECNGMIVVNGNVALVFDTPATEESSEELLEFLIEQKKLKIKAVVATHFHDDCLAGLEAFHSRGIPSYSTSLTAKLAEAEDNLVPQKTFERSLVLKAGKSEVLLHYPGEGHTRDNVVAYFAAEKVMFGGCLVKCMDASKGYLGDANEEKWTETIEVLKAKFPDVQTVIPGHGPYGGIELLDYTANLFRE